MSSDEIQVRGQAAAEGPASMALRSVRTEIQGGKRRSTMAKYLIQASYTLDGIKGVKARGGSARRDAVEQALRSVGGRMESFYFAFGEADVYVVADVPGNVEVAALSLATCAGGGAHTKTVVLLTAEEMDEAAKKQVGYEPPK
jgi:uncharacterized protein with GYD domain